MEMHPGKMELPRLKRAIPPAPRRPRESSHSRGDGTSPETTSSDNTVTRPPVKWKRAGGAKVKTGCITCKIRRVKCDETKPSCTRCTSTGRKCDGYVLGQNRDFSSSPSRSPAPETQIVTRTVGTPQERRALDFFYSCTAPQLSGYFDAAFWKKLVLQISQSEPTIRYAVIAVSLAHEQTERAEQLEEEIDGSHGQLALKEYNKAISSLSIHLSRSPSVQIPLMTCVLFICLEFLRRDVDSAMAHTRNGFNILNTWRSRNSLMSSSPSSREESDFVEDHLTPIFSRLGITAELFGNGFPLTTKVYATNFEEDAPFHFASMAEARVTLVDGMNASLRFIRETTDCRYMNQINIDQIIRHTHLLNRLQAWLDGFESFIATRRTSDTNSLTEEEEHGSDLLRIHYLTIYVWLSAAISPDEMTYDNHMESFTTIVRLANKLHDSAAPSAFSTNTSTSSTSNQPANPFFESTRNSTSKSGSSPAPPKFSFELGLIAPIYFVAIKCRDPYTRRSALSLLHRADKRREGLVDATRAFKIASRVVELEEAHLRPANVNARFLAGTRDRNILYGFDTMDGVHRDKMGRRVELPVPSDSDRIYPNKVGPITDVGEGERFRAGTGGAMGMSMIGGLKAGLEDRCYEVKWLQGGSSQSKSSSPEPSVGPRTPQPYPQQHPDPRRKFSAAALDDLFRVYAIDQLPDNPQQPSHPDSHSTGPLGPGAADINMEKHRNQGFMTGSCMTNPPLPLSPLSKPKTRRIMGDGIHGSASVQPVTFRLRPRGAEGEWEILEEFVEM
ncbi:hypothetical protein K402DRAFT_397855 [Aulographum hederae CBS 113979]|uniref:Zn(2)-C6 fungal-type domain-containing protein n=1 Tax=Aulographum hederae CBS 113979 TaxID=1176131 RepID=A0A6G1GMR6_9PEZI|nr:hypothetical protein K402DRAFT_397855 [Aulographum hederae CBS 113979]